MGPQDHRMVDLKDTVHETLKAIDAKMYSSLVSALGDGTDVVKRIRSETTRGSGQPAMAMMDAHFNYEMKKRSRQAHKEFLKVKLDGVRKLDSFVIEVKGQLKTMREAGQSMPSDMLVDQLTEAVKGVKSMSTWPAKFQTEDPVGQTEEKIVDMLEKAVVAFQSETNAAKKQAATGAAATGFHKGGGKGRGGKDGGKGGRGKNDGKQPWGNQWNNPNNQWNNNQWNNHWNPQGKNNGKRGGLNGKGGGNPKGQGQWAGKRIQPTWQNNTPWNWFKGTPPGGDGGKESDGRCQLCRRTNHKSEDCYWKPGGKAASALQTGEWQQWNNQGGYGPQQGDGGHKFHNSGQPQQHYQLHGTPAQNASMPHSAQSGVHSAAPSASALGHQTPRQSAPSMGGSSVSASECRWTGSENNAGAAVDRYMEGVLAKFILRKAGIDVGDAAPHVCSGAVGQFQSIAEDNPLDSNEQGASKGTCDNDSVSQLQELAAGVNVWVGDTGASFNVKGGAKKPENVVENDSIQLHTVSGLQDANKSIPDHKIPFLGKREALWIPGSPNSMFIGEQVIDYRHRMVWDPDEGCWMERKENGDIINFDIVNKVPVVIGASMEKNTVHKAMDVILSDKRLRDDFFEMEKVSADDQVQSVANPLKKSLGVPTTNHVPESKKSDIVNIEVEESREEKPKNEIIQRVATDANVNSNSKKNEGP